MNSARLSHSPRLQRVHQLLKSGRPYTTMQIIRKARVCAVNSICAELRSNGLDIICTRLGNLWYYRMA